MYIIIVVHYITYFVVDNDLFIICRRLRDRLVAGPSRRTRVNEASEKSDSDWVSNSISLWLTTWNGSTVINFWCSNISHLWCISGSIDITMLHFLLLRVTDSRHMPRVHGNGASKTFLCLTIDILISYYSVHSISNWTPPSALSRDEWWHADMTIGSYSYRPKRTIPSSTWQPRFAIVIFDALNFLKANSRFSSSPTGTFLLLSTPFLALDLVARLAIIPAQLSVTEFRS